MTLNLQSKPDLFSSQSVLLLSRSQIWQIRNYLQFSIWGRRAHAIPSNKPLEQRDGVQSTQEVRTEVVLPAWVHLKPRQWIALPLQCPEPPCRAGCQQPWHALLTLGCSRALPNCSLPCRQTPAARINPAFSPGLAATACASKGGEGTDTRRGS